VSAVAGDLDVVAVPWIKVTSPLTEVLSKRVAGQPSMQSEVLSPIRPGTNTGYGWFYPIPGKDNGGPCSCLPAGKIIPCSERLSGKSHSGRLLLNRKGD